MREPWLFLEAVGAPASDVGGAARWPQEDGAQRAGFEPGVGGELALHVGAQLRPIGAAQEEVFDEPAFGAGAPILLGHDIELPRTGVRERGIEEARVQRRVLEHEPQLEAAAAVQLGDAGLFEARPQQVERDAVAADFGAERETTACSATLERLGVTREVAFVTSTFVDQAHRRTRRQTKRFRELLEWRSE